MSWTAYRVVLRLTGPLHIGRSKIGNLQRTRPYVIGRTLWGALTMRITRSLPNPTAQKYREIGRSLHDLLATTYFYPTLDPAGLQEPAWPWPAAELARFNNRHVASYAGTALQASGQSAAENTLHEIEQLLPYTRDGSPVYLGGYIIERDDLKRDELDWQAALSRLQLGGERSYGWGAVQPEIVKKLALPAGQTSLSLFARPACTLSLSGERPLVRLASGESLLAHTAVNPALQVRGKIEPLVGRIWHNGDGRGLDYSGICYLPGSTVAEDTELQIGHFGLWRVPQDARQTT